MFFNLYKAEVENQLDQKIKVVRSDREGEYYSRINQDRINQEIFVDFLRENGIVPQYTNPGTPQHNGISERQNRTYQNVVRSLMSHFDQLESFWDEAIKTVVYLNNRIPCKVAPETPYKRWTE